MILLVIYNIRKCYNDSFVANARTASSATTSIVLIPIKHNLSVLSSLEFRSSALDQINSTTSVEYYFGLVAN